MQMNEKDPLIAVVVPVYNVEKFLPQCVDSLLNQTWKNLELILVDDGSKDNSWAIMQDYARQDERIHLVRQKNGGLSAARNAGVDAAKGEYIGFLDGDDYLAPETYELLYSAMAKYDAQMAVCSFEYVDENGNVLPTDSPMTKEEVLTGNEAIERISSPRGWYYVTVPNRLYRRELFDKVHFPVGRFHEDEHTVHLFYKQCQRVAVVPRNLYYYVQHGNSIMHRDSIRKCIDFIDSALDQMKYAEENGLVKHMFYCSDSMLKKIAELKRSGLLEEEGKQAVFEQETARVSRNIRRLLKLRGNWESKAKILLFCFSPEMYCRLSQLKNRKKRR